MRSLKTQLDQPRIAPDEIQGLELKREALLALKRRYEALEDQVKAVEAELVRRLELGAEVPEGYDLRVSVKEVRYPSWKSEFTAMAGSDATQRVLDQTEPTIFKKLTIGQGF